MTSTHSSVKESLNDVLSRMQIAMKNRRDDLQSVNPTLVAVSKTKPIDLIIEAYEEGQRHFGENYVQELVSKATDERILENCQDIKWHFIGHLQSNKASNVATLPNLYLIETVDSKKLATILNGTIAKHKPSEPLRVFVQVNTSLEEDKNGVLPDEVSFLSKYIIDECPHLMFCGLMTIGQFGYDLSLGPNPDFLTLIKCKEIICQELNISSNGVELSMGMSDDYEHAIEVGSSNIRVGSSIFGFRAKKFKTSQP